MMFFVLSEVFSETNSEPDIQLKQAQAYINSGDFSSAGQILSDIASSYPDTEYGLLSQTLLLKLKIKQKDTAAAQCMDNLITAFSKNAALPSYLFDIAHEYEKTGLKLESQNVYKYINDAFPSSDYAVRV
jgi:TolA-binding protein